MNAVTANSFAWRDLYTSFGRSGCKLVDTGGAVLKIAPPGKQTERLRRQAEWMGRYQNADAMPLVYSFGDGWMLMEKLDRAGEFASPAAALQVLAKLWREEAEEGDPGWCYAVYKYADRIAPDLAAHLPPFLRDAFSPWVVTHGDPTLDNLMSRRDQPVFVDPLPPEEHTPNKRALDIGKLLMSVHGWHEAEYGDSDRLRTWRAVVDVVVPDLVQDAREAKMCWAFAVYHLIRALPYARNRQAVYRAARAIVEERLT